MEWWPEGEVTLSAVLVEAGKRGDSPMSRGFTEWIFGIGRKGFNPAGVPIGIGGGIVLGAIAHSIGAGIIVGIASGLFLSYAIGRKPDRCPPSSNSET